MTSNNETVRNIIGLLKKLNGGQLPPNFICHIEVKNGLFEKLSLSDMSRVKVIREVSPVCNNN